MRHTKVFFLVLISLLVTSSFSFAEDFPLRAKYPNVKYITTEQLAAQYGKTIIIDVRSKFEFEVAKGRSYIVHGQKEFYFNKNVSNIVRMTLIPKIL